MNKKVNMEDIAKELGVSKNTVSLALRGMPGISEDTKKIIFDKAQELGYKYKKSTSPNNPTVGSRCICLIVAKNTMDSAGFFSSIQMGIEDEARQNGINIILYYFDESSTTFELPLCIKDGIASAIITLGRFSIDTIKEFNRLNIPLVMIDHYFDNMRLDYILTDNHSGAYLAVEHLIKCSHSKIGFIGNINTSPCFADRYLGYLNALKSYDITVNDDYILQNISLENVAKQGISIASNMLLSLPQFPTAFFCANDAEAIALIKVLNSIGKKVPEDVSVIGFDDIDSASTVTPSLTTIKVEKTLMGKKAIRRILEKLEFKYSVEEKLLISAYLIERDSIKNLKEL